MSLTQEEINELQKYFMTRRFEYTISDLKSMAKEKNIKGYYRMNKVTLYLKLRDGMNEFYRFKFDWHMDNKTLDKSLEISLKNDSNESKENWVNLNKRYLCEHERYKYSCRLCKGKLYVNMANKNITVKFVWVVLYVNIKDGDTFAKNAVEKVFVSMVNRDRFVILAGE